MRPPSDDDWAALVSRCPQMQVYAVQTTGIVCRFGCPSRLPQRHNVILFMSREAAIAEGFRPCLRCGANLET